MVYDKGMVNIIMGKVIIMSEIGFKIKDKEKENVFIMMVVIMKEIGIRDKDKAMGNIFLQMVVMKRVNLLIINHKEFLKGLITEDFIIGK